MSNATATDHAWAAGFLDGEGCFSAVKRVAKSGAHVGRTAYYIDVAAAQVDLAPLHRLRSLYGGAIYVHQRGNDRHAKSHKWKINSKPCAAMLALILPNLTVKRLQANVLLTLQHRLTPGGRIKLSADEYRERDRLVAESRWLNRRGVPKGTAPPMPPRRTRPQLRLLDEETA